MTTNNCCDTNIIMGEFIAVMRHADASWHEKRVNEPLLRPEDEVQAAFRAMQLKDKGFDLREIAVSENAARTTQTAMEMQKAALLEEEGIRRRYPQLNEILTPGLTRDELRALLRARQLPTGFGLYKGGKELLDHMPPEDIWVTHASRMAGMIVALKDRMDLKTLPRSLVVPCLGYVIIHREFKVPPQYNFTAIPKEIRDILKVA